MWCNAIRTGTNSRLVGAGLLVERLGLEPSARGAQADAVSDELLAAQLSSRRVRLGARRGGQDCRSQPGEINGWRGLPLRRPSREHVPLPTTPWPACKTIVSALPRSKNPAQGAQGGQGGANFQQLIQLITDTIAPTTWDEVGGPGAISSYSAGGGVYVDAEGVVRRAVREAAGSGLAVARLEAIQVASEPRGKSAGKTNTDVRADAALRKVSLTRLEKQVQLRLAAGRRPTEEMLTLGGLEKIKYVFRLSRNWRRGAGRSRRRMACRRRKGGWSARPRAGRSCNWTIWWWFCGI